MGRENKQLNGQLLSQPDISKQRNLSRGSLAVFLSAYLAKCLLGVNVLEAGAYPKQSEV